MGWGHENKCFIDPSTSDAKTVATWCRGGTARGFFYTDRYDRATNDMLIIFDGFGNTHGSMIAELGRTRRDDFSECLIVAEDGNVRVERLTKTLSIDSITCFQKYSAFWKTLASHLGNHAPKLIPMD